MDFTSHAAGTTLSETTSPLVATVGAWASFGGAMMCAFEAMRDEPRWDRAAGHGAALGAAVGGLVVLHDVIAAW